LSERKETVINYPYHKNRKVSLLPNFSDIVDAYKKLPASLFLTIGIVLSIVLFSPDFFAKSIGIQYFRESYKVFIGPVWLLVIAILISRGIGLVQLKFRKIKAERHRKKQLENLTPDEKHCLLHFTEGQLPTIYRNMHDSAICALATKKIVYRASAIVMDFDVIPYCIQPWAKEILEKYPDLLD